METERGEGWGGLGSWILAARPKTLPAAVVPVGIGTALAWKLGVSQWEVAGICLVFALLIQVGTNFANDYFDFVKGADTLERLGPTRAVAAGWVRPEQMRGAMAGVFLSALGVGLLLLPYGGVALLPVGLACIVFGVAYTGGPYPLAYKGLGEVFVLVFFGLVATAGTFYVQAGGFPELVGVKTLPLALVAGLVPGALAVNLLVVNNMRDRSSDAKAGKRTLAVVFGRRFAEIEFAVGGVIAFAATGVLAWKLQSCWLLLPIGLGPWFVVQVRHIHRASEREQWQVALQGAAAYLLLSGALLILGVVAAG